MLCVLRPAGPGDTYIFSFVANAVDSNQSSFSHEELYIFVSTPLTCYADQIPIVIKGCVYSSKGKQKNNLLYLVFLKIYLVSGHFGEQRNTAFSP